MDQKQLDDLEANETPNDFTSETSDFSSQEPAREDIVEEMNESELPEAESVGESEVPPVQEEKENDVNDILENGNHNTEAPEEKPLSETKVEVDAVASPSECGAECSTSCSPTSDCSPSLTPEEKTNKVEANKVDPWASSESEETSKPGSTWRTISGVLLILLVVAVYTNGFNFTGATVVATGSLTQIDAEETVLDYVNNNLLQPPFTATAESSEDVGALYQVTLDVDGQAVDSYITKDGRFFFPQGFDLADAPIGLDGPTGSEIPEADLVAVSVDDDAVLGDADAPVTIIEFGDFECPFCEKGWQTMKQVEEKYVKSGKVKIVFRDFPLSFHQQAKPAAMASECAHEQGKFWEFHDLLFENQASLGTENYKKWAADLGLDTTQFNACFDSGKYSEEVDLDFADGQKYGVSGTPAFFINGQMISGAQPFAVFEGAIEAALQGASEEPVDEVEEEPTEEVTETEEDLEPVESTTKELQIDTKKWRFDPQVVEVNQGDLVKLTVSSEEFDLNFILSAFGVSEKLTAGESVTVEFTADKKGTFEFLCGDYCNQYGVVQGAALKGELVVN